MQIAPAGVELAFEVTYSADDLPVAMSVFDTSGSSPSLVQGPAAMTVLADTNTYVGKFTPTVGKTYVLVMAVYTDDTYETLDTDYGQGSESIVALQTQSPVQNVVGFVDC